MIIAHYKTIAQETHGKNTLPDMEANITPDPLQ
jgi:hypothetical protein